MILSTGRQLPVASFLLLHTGEFTLPNKERFDPSRNLAPGDVTSHQSPDSWHYWLVQIKQSKTDQQCQGVTLYMSHTNHSVYPACAMKSNVALRWRCPNLSEVLQLFLQSVPDQATARNVHLVDTAFGLVGPHPLLWLVLLTTRFKC